MNRYYLSCRWLVAVLFSLVVTLGHGQQKIREHNGRPVKIIYFRAPKEAPSKSYLYAKDKVLETELPRSHFSETFYIPRGEYSLHFLPHLLQKGDKLPEKTPSVSISEKWQKVLLLVFENKKNKVMPIKVRAINASDSVFGNGSIYMINFSSVTVTGTVGNKEITVGPNKSKIIRNPIKENGVYATKLDMVKHNTEQPQRFIRQMWQQSDLRRSVLFILPQDPPKYATYYTTNLSQF